mgnify:CR=1 FL=1
MFTAFSSAIGALIDRAEANKRENRTLVATRDFLRSELRDLLDDLDERDARAKPRKKGKARVDDGSDVEQPVDAAT